MTQQEIVKELHLIALDYARFTIDKEQCDQAEPIIAVALAHDEGEKMPVAILPVGTMQHDSAGKDKLAQLLVNVWQNPRALASMYVSEAWCLRNESHDDKDKIQATLSEYEAGKIDSLESVPGCVESLMITITTRDGKQIMFAHKIVTNEGGKRSVSDDLIGGLNQSGELGGRFGHLGPVPDVKHQH